MLCFPAPCRGVSLESVHELDPRPLLCILILRDAMAKTVFILGAGASASAGAPLMNQFLDVAVDLLNSRRFGDATDRIQRLFEFKASLRAVYANASIDLHNIESLLSAIEMGITIDGVASITPSELQDLLDSSKAMIVRTLENSIRFPVADGTSAPRARPTTDYERFVQRVESTSGRDVCYITFNYDVALDLAVVANFGAVNYCIDDESCSSAPTLLKLHGSTNWGISPATQRIVAFDLGSYLRKGLITTTQEQYVTLSPSLDLRDTFGVDPRSVIVPPTWSKSSHHRSIAGVWNRASRELSTAQAIFVVGYSLPPSDAFFRQFFALSTLHNDDIRHFVVVDPDPSVGERFKDLLGAGALKRFHYERRDFNSLGRHSGTHVFD